MPPKRSSTSCLRLLRVVFLAVAVSADTAVAPSPSTGASVDAGSSGTSLEAAGPARTDGVRRETGVRQQDDGGIGAVGTTRLGERGGVEEMRIDADEDEEADMDAEVARDPYIFDADGQQHRQGGIFDSDEPNDKIEVNLADDAPATAHKDETVGANLFLHNAREDASNVTVSNSEQGATNSKASKESKASKSKQSKQSKHSKKEPTFEAFIQVTIPAELILQGFDEVNPSTQAVLEKSIQDVAEAGLENDSQRVSDVIISSIKETEAAAATTRRLQLPSSSTAEYELILQETCSTSTCDEQIESSTMSEDVMSHMRDEIEGGGFTATFLSNAEACGEECENILDVQVVNGTFGDPDVVVVNQTDAPTYFPTPAPPSSTKAPSDEPTQSPSGKPSVEPSGQPSEAPTATPCMEREELEVVINVKTDRFPDETSWTLTSNDCGGGETLIEARDFSNHARNTLFTDRMCLPYGEYVFDIYDSFGDGICCSYGSGFYDIIVDGDTVRTGGEFGYSESTTLGSCTYRPTMSPTTSMAPSKSPAPSLAPSLSMAPSETSAPTHSPTEPDDDYYYYYYEYPTPHPTSLAPTSSQRPTITKIPSHQPSITSSPSGSPTPCQGMDIEVEIKTDEYPSETTWKLENICDSESEPTEVGSGGPYSEEKTKFIHPLCLPESKYRFTVEDSYGDGICCGWGRGFYEIRVDGELVHDGGKFGDEETKIVGTSCGFPTASPTTARPTVSFQPSVSPRPSAPTFSPTSSPTLSPTLSPNTIEGPESPSPTHGFPTYAPNEDDSRTKLPTIEPDSYSYPTYAPNEETYSPTFQKFPTFSPVRTLRESSETYAPTKGDDVGTWPPTVAPVFSPTVNPSIAPSSSPSRTFTCPPSVGQDLLKVEIYIRTDQYPGETSWEIRNSGDCGEQEGVLVTSPDYSAKFTQYDRTLCLPYGSYIYTINDSWGDGICCAEGDGSYKVIVDGEMVSEGGDFNDTESVSFGSCTQRPSPSPTASAAPSESTAPSFDPSASLVPTKSNPPSGTPPTAPPTLSPTTNAPTFPLTASSMPTPAPAPCSCGNRGTTVEVRINTDYWPHETRWTLKNTCTTEQNPASDGPYGGEPTSHAHTLCCLPDGAYQFNIMDTYGDGIYLLNGNENAYEVSIVSQDRAVVLASGSGDFTYFEVTDFVLGSACATSSPRPSAQPTMTLHPSINPTWSPTDLSSSNPSNSPTIACAENEDVLQIELTTDIFPEETSWTVIDCDQDKDAEWSSPQYNTQSTVQPTEWICLPQSLGYLFTIDDSYGDGICCSWGQGSYDLILNGNVIKSGGDFGDSESTTIIGTCPTASPTENPTTKTPTEFPTNIPSVSSKPTLSPAPSEPPSVTSLPSSAPTPCQGYAVEIKIKTDRYPYETTWELESLCGAGLQESGGPYTQKETLYTHEFCLPDGEHKFTVYDSFGDGLCCGYGQGSYELIVDGTLIKSGGDFDDTESTAFGRDCPTLSPSISAKPTASSPPSMHPSASSSPTESTAPTQPTLWPTYNWTPWPTWTPTPRPTLSPSTSSAPTESSQPSSHPTKSSAPTESSAPTPTCVLDPNPDSFESGHFPSPPWSTGGDGVWTLADDRFFDGDYSIISPDLDGSVGRAVSNATLQTCEEFSGGVLRLNAFASVFPPFDWFHIYVDGSVAGAMVDVNDWTTVELVLQPGLHTIDFSYEYNPFELSGLPPPPSSREGRVWIDVVEIEESTSPWPDPNYWTPSPQSPSYWADFSPSSENDQTAPWPSPSTKEQATLLPPPGREKQTAPRSKPHPPIVTKDHPMAWPSPSTEEHAALPPPGRKKHYSTHMQPPSKPRQSAGAKDETARAKEQAIPPQRPGKEKHHTAHRPPNKPRPSTAKKDHAATRPSPTANERAAPPQVPSEEKQTAPQKFK